MNTEQKNMIWSRVENDINNTKSRTMKIYARNTMVIAIAAVLLFTALSTTTLAEAFTDWVKGIILVRQDKGEVVQYNIVADVTKEDVDQHKSDEAAGLITKLQYEEFNFDNIADMESFFKEAYPNAVFNNNKIFKTPSYMPAGIKFDKLTFKKTDEIYNASVLLNYTGKYDNNFLNNIFVNYSYFNVKYDPNFSTHYNEDALIKSITVSGQQAYMVMQNYEAIDTTYFSINMITDNYSVCVYTTARISPDDAAQVQNVENELMKIAESMQ